MNNEIDDIINEVTTLFKNSKIKKINKKFTLNDLNSYEDACMILNENPIVDCDYSKKIKTIVKAANFIDNDYNLWVANWTDSNEYKYLTYFENKGSGFGFDDVGSWYSNAYAPLGFYYKNSNTCELITKRFIKLYLDWLQE